MPQPSKDDPGKDTVSFSDSSGHVVLGQYDGHTTSLFIPKEEAAAILLKHRNIVNANPKLLAFAESFLNWHNLIAQPNQEGEVMTEHKHTQGPWTVTHAIIGSAEPVKHPSAIVASPSGSVDTICDFDWMTRRGLTEQQANASLIAAAPDLLAACEHALALLEPFDDPGLSLGLGSNALAPIRAAIAKAKGGAA